MAIKKAPASFDPTKAAKKSGNAYVGYDLRTDDYINSGSYSLNAILSGDVYKGIPGNLITMYAGIEAVGKTYIMLRGAYQLKQAGYHIYYLDSEVAVSDASFELYGFEKSEYTIMPVQTVEDARRQMFSIVDAYTEYANGIKRGSEDWKNRTKIAFFLDSIGNLSSNKSVADTRDNKDTRDMSKQQSLKRLFLDLTVPLGMAGIPFLMSNHVYEQVGSYVPSKVVSGGSGGKYNASNILMLSKKDVKDPKTKEAVGSEITVVAKKSRCVRPMTKVKFYLDYKRGLMPWYGLGEIAESAGLIKKVKIGTSNFYRIQDPRKPKEEWIEVPCAKIDRRDAIGTILDPLNDWIKENFILKSDLDDSDDIDIDMSEFELEGTETEDDED